MKSVFYVQPVGINTRLCFCSILFTSLFYKYIKSVCILYQLQAAAKKIFRVKLQTVCGLNLLFNFCVKRITMSRVNISNVYAQKSHSEIIPKHCCEYLTCNVLFVHSHKTVHHHCCIFIFMSNDITSSWKGLKTKSGQKQVMIQELQKAVSSYLSRLTGVSCKAQAASSWSSASYWPWDGFAFNGRAFRAAKTK